MSSDTHVDEESTTQRTGTVLPWVNTALFVVAGLVVILCIYIRFRLLNVPLERDEGEFAYFGQLILKGIPPFAAAYSMKLPGIYGMYALIMSLLGQTVQGIHLGLLFTNLATIYLLFLLGTRIGDTRAGAVTAAAYALLSVSFSVLGIFAHATHFVVLFVVAGFLCLFKALDRNNLPLVLLSGFLFGIAFTMKQHAAILVIFAFLYFLRRIRNNALSGKRIMTAGFTFLFGIMLPYALIVIWMTQAGVFNVFWFWTVQYAREYTSSETIGNGIATLINQTRDIVMPQFPLWLLAVAAGGLLATTQGRTKDRFFLFGLIAFSALAICPGFYFRQHYYIMLLPAIALLIGVVVQTATSALSHQGHFRQVIPLFLFTAAVTYGFVSESSYFFATSPAEISRSVYGTNPFPEAAEIARYIREHTTTNDRIAVLGSEPEICFHADRLSATGHIYMYGLMENQPYAEQMQLQMIREIETARPKYIIAVNVDVSWLVRPTSSQKILDWGENYVRNFYDLVGVVDILGGYPTRYVWDDKASRYEHVSDSYLTIFKRKS
jgi:Dolichyl-phosphate-mannose-protein mannosyltransferase